MLVDQRRALAAQRLGQQRQRIAVDGERGGMELHELEIDEPRAGRRGERQPVARRLARVGGVAIELAEPAGREHDPRRGVKTSSRPARSAAPDHRRRRPLAVDLEQRVDEGRARGARSTAICRDRGRRARAPARRRSSRRGRGGSAAGCAPPRGRASSSPAAPRSNSAPSSIRRADREPRRRGPGASAISGVDQTGAGGDGVGGVELRRVAPVPPRPRRRPAPRGSRPDASRLLVEQDAPRSRRAARARRRGRRRRCRRRSRRR